MKQHTEKSTPRAQRKDKGKPRWTERDDYCLWWIGEQRVVRYDQLQRLLARQSDCETARSGWLSASRTTQTIKRWQEAELVSYARPYIRRPGFVWLSRKGLRFVELDYRYSEPKESQLTHLSYINQLRLKLEDDDQEDEGNGSASAPYWRSRSAVRQASGSSTFQTASSRSRPG